MHPSSGNRNAPLSDRRQVRRITSWRSPLAHLSEGLFKHVIRACLNAESVEKCVPQQGKVTLEGGTRQQGREPCKGADAGGRRQGH